MVDAPKVGDLVRPLRMGPEDDRMGLLGKPPDSWEPTPRICGHLLIGELAVVIDVVGNLTKVYGPSGIGWVPGSVITQVKDLMRDAPR